VSRGLTLQEGAAAARSNHRSRVDEPEAETAKFVGEHEERREERVHVKVNQPDGAGRRQHTTAETARETYTRGTCETMSGMKRSMHSHLLPNPSEKVTNIELKTYTLVADVAIECHACEVEVVEEEDEDDADERAVTSGTRTRAA
jgi:hypothetical protein